MTINNKLPPYDIEQIQHENDAEARRILAFGKTAGGAYVPLLVGSDGSLGYIKLDGKSTTLASIPFAAGLSSSDDVLISGGTLHVYDTSVRQFVVGYDVSNYAFMEVGPSGDLTLECSGKDISFTDNDLSTTGTIGGVNVTSGADPGHTHTTSSVSGFIKLDGTSTTTAAIPFAKDIEVSGDQETAWIRLGSTESGIGQISNNKEISFYSDGEGEVGTMMLGGNRSFDLDMCINLCATDIDYGLCAGDVNVKGELTISSPSQDYKFFARPTPSDHLEIQNQTSGKGCYFQMFTKDGDGSDSNFWEIWGKGLPTSTTNRERILIGWDYTRNVYKFSVDANGAGTSRPLVLETDNNTGQVTLNTDGSTDLGDGGTTNYLSVSSTGNLSFTGSAEFHPPRVSQSAQPTPSVGEMMIWRDPDDNKTYIVYNDTDEGVRKVELT